MSKNESLENSEPMMAADTPAPVVAAPVPEAQRLKRIDALRGVALLGILVINIPGFSMPNYFTESFHTDPSTLNFWLLSITSIFVEGKMRALFGMLFGAGVVLFVTKKEQSGKSITGLFYRRMFWLVIFGLIHSHVILWIGDILYIYGICGMIIYLFRNVNPKYLCLGVPLVALVSFGSSAALLTYVRGIRLDYVDAKRAADAGEELSEKQTKALADWRELEQKFFPNREDAQENTRTMKSNYKAIAAHLRPMAFDIQTKVVFVEIWDSVALMLLGIALYRWGYLQGNWSNRSYWNVIFVGYGLGVPLATYFVWHGVVYNPTMEASMERLEKVGVDWVGLIYPFQRILLVLAHSSALILLDKAQVAPKLFQRLAAAGQMAFTNYIMQSLICTWFFFGYGLNFYGELDYSQIHLVVFAVWIFQLWLSPLWLKYFLFGPLEWLWRSLTYCRIQPFVRSR